MERNMSRITVNQDKVLEIKRQEVLNKRSAAYKTESDPLKIEAEYDAMKNGTTPDYSKWVAKVSEIKSRYPFPN